MRKLVIVNRGCGGIGKSSAIKAVYQLLKDKGYNPDEEVWQGGDIKAIFEIDGVKVGISSQGDPGSCMKDNIEDFVKMECEIIVTACRMKGDTYRKVYYELGEEQDYDIIWYGHYVYQVLEAEEVQENFNKRYAEQVVKLIEERIAGTF
ncbi:MAG: hypothetical protein KBT27_05990 [Prevotellaceae bacterium]|nr:hypothetical protein [Candidatus Faecinaster equi]